MTRVVTSANGYVLNLSVEEDRIELKQLKYDMVSKNWQQMNHECINLENDAFLFDRSRPLVNQNDAIVFSGQVNGNKSLNKLICLLFDPQTQIFNFDIQLSLQLSELASLCTTDLFIKIYPNKKFFFFTIYSQNCQIGLKIYHNFNQSGIECLTYEIKNGLSTLEQVSVLHWTRIQPTTIDQALDYLNFKLLATLNFECKNKTMLESYLFEPFGGVLCLNNENMFAQYAQFGNRDMSLVDETPNYLSLNKKFSKKPIKLESLCLTEFKIGKDKSTFWLKGACFLIVSLNGQSYMIGLANGQRTFIKELSINVSSIKYEQINDRHYLFASDAKNFYQVFTLPDLRMIFESNEILDMLVDYFLEDSKAILIINEADFVLKQSFDFTPAFDHSHNSDSAQEFSMDLSASFSQPEAKDNSCVADLVKVLEHKDRMSDLVQQDLQVQMRQKLALVAQISTLHHHQCSQDTALPKLVQLYSKDLNHTRTSTHNLSFDLKAQWSCFLGQKLLLNFLIKTPHEFNNLTCAILIRTGSVAQTIICHECRQFSMRLNANMVKTLQDGQFEAEYFLSINHQETNSDLGLLTLELSNQLVEKLVANFNFEATLLVNYKNGSNFLRQYFPIKFDLTDNLVINKVCFGPQVYLSVLNYYESSLSRSVVRLKIFSIGEALFTQLVTEQLNFEKVATFGQKNVFYLNKQALLTDCFLVMELSTDCLKLTIYTGNNEQSILLVRLMDKHLSRMSEQSIPIEIDIDQDIDSLLAALKNEVADLVTAEADRDKTPRAGSQKELITDNQILKLFS